MMDVNELKNARAILEKYKRGLCSEDELSMLESWYNSFEIEVLPHLNQAQFESIAASKAPVVKLKRFSLWPKSNSYRAVAAASVVLVASLGYYFYTSNLNGSFTTEASTNDIAPGKQGATLTLANGKKILLTDGNTGELAKEPGVRITKDADGQLTYVLQSASLSRSDSEGSKGPSYHTLSTSKGQTYSVILPDSSKVWLNAASTLKYPTSFASLKERRVELTGEAYFEVAKDKRHAFIVKAKGQEVEVLGTHFNINAYPDDPSTKTTLLEGAVRVSSLDLLPKNRDKLPASGMTKVLTPGQQSILPDNQSIFTMRQVDLEEVVAWKNGYFKFNENLQSIMEKVARWYNMEVAYEVTPDPNYTYQGEISRSKPLSEVLSMMQYSEKARFKVQGRRIMVMK